MSTQKRALAPTSSGQPSQPKRPCCAPVDQEWSGSERNGVPSSYMTVEAIRGVVRQAVELAMPHFQSQEWSGSERNGVLSSYLVEAIRGVVRQELEHVMPRWAEPIQSIRNALKDIMQQMPSKENDFQKQTKALELGNSSSAHLRRPNAKSTENNGARHLQLQLQTKLSHPVFTGKKIEGEEGARIYVALIDANTGDVVTSGPESTIKLDVVVLEGDFNKDDEDTWAPEEFENYVVKEREGKGLLLVGDLVVKLKRGFGELGQLIFTDNSSWNRSKTFRIGVKVASGFCGSTRIREAKTDAFPVKEHRGEAYRKHYPPASDDEVWRLEKIAKDGKPQQKLSEAGIYKVEDFLLQLFTDPKKLREILGKSMTEKKWDILVSHAKTCKTKWKIYFDYPDGMTKHGAVFNTNNKPIGLVKDRVYFAIDQLSAQEKEHGDAIVKKALDNWNNVREFNGETFSDSMQKNNASSFPTQICEVQIENLTSVQPNGAPQICAAPVGPEAFPANAGSTAEVHCPGHDGVDALALPVLLDGISRPTAHQPLSSDCLNVLISPGDSGFATVGSPIQSNGVNLQCAMRSQMIDCLGQMYYTVNEHVRPWEPPHTSASQCSSRLFPECNHMMEDYQPKVCDDLDCWFPDDFVQTPPCDEDAVRGTSKGVKGWLKIKAVLQWGIFYRRRVRLVPLDEPPNEVQA